MPRISQLRIIVESEPNPGGWNMAVDEALLESAVSAQTATLRLYEWRVPTISLGYFQKPEELARDPVLSRLPVVRRLSGGGAILHDDELTYSLTLPADQSLFRQPHDLYTIVHGAFCEALRSVGIPVEFRGTTVKNADEPLLCFQRQDAHDVTLRGIKVLGSAQRRRRGAIMQHGSLIRRASSAAPQLSGLRDLCEEDLPKNLMKIITNHVSAAVSETEIYGIMSGAEIDLTKRICEQQSSYFLHD